MREAGREPTLDELLHDGLVRLIMDRDGLTPEDVRHVIRETASRRRRGGVVVERHALVQAAA